MKYRTFGKTGLRISAITLGGTTFGGHYEAMSDEQGLRTLETAIDVGINFIDTSPYYGATTSETKLGQCLKHIPRDRYYIGTKLGRYGLDKFDFSAKRVAESVDESLQRLQLDHLDVIQCHDIEFVDINQIIEETIPAMRQVVKTGKARFIGVTGLPVAIFKKVMDHVDVDVMLSYCHYCLVDTALQEIVPYLQSKNVGIINASPFSMGSLTPRGAPDWHPAPKEFKEACHKAAAHCQSKGVNICKIALQFALANPDMHTTLVGAASPEFVKENVKWMDEPMDTQLLHEIQAMLKPVHNLTWPSGRPENN